MIHHKYRDQSPDQVEELLSNYLIDSWSYSRLSSFARNEKEFEMRYIYCIYPRVSSTTVAGTAYHAALQFYFNGLKNGMKYDIVDLEQIAFDVIESTPANEWKIQKTTPTVDDCIQTATKTVSALLRNFLKEVEVYTSEIDEILMVEEKMTQWLSVNGVDIPLPCVGVVDLVVRMKDGRVVIIDHKSRRSFTDEQEMKFTGGKQAIVYTKMFEECTGIDVNEVWFVENKYSQNKDGSPQLQPFKIVMDDDTRRLYEAMIYEPLKRMLEAVSNPDYVY